jgi:hypothetical protein
VAELEPATISLDFELFFQKASAGPSSCVKIKPPFGIFQTLQDTAGLLST